MSKSRSLSTSANSSKKSRLSAADADLKRRLQKLKGVMALKMADTDGLPLASPSSTVPCKAIRNLYWIKEPGERFKPGDKLGLIIRRHSMIAAAQKLLAAEQRKILRLGQEMQHQGLKHNASKRQDPKLLKQPDQPKLLSQRLSVPTLDRVEETSEIADDLELPSIEVFGSIDHDNRQVKRQGHQLVSYVTPIKSSLNSLRFCSHRSHMAALVKS